MKKLKRFKVTAGCKCYGCNKERRRLNKHRRVLRKLAKDNHNYLLNSKLF